MNEAIQDDMQAEIEQVVALLRETYDLGAYPRTSDGPAFDARVAALEGALGRLKTRFDDYLMSAWSAEMDAAIRSAQRRRDG